MKRYNFAGRRPRRLLGVLARLEVQPKSETTLKEIEIVKSKISQIESVK